MARGEPITDALAVGKLKDRTNFDPQRKSAKNQFIPKQADFPRCGTAQNNIKIRYSPADDEKMINYSFIYIIYILKFCSLLVFENISWKF